MAECQTMDTVGPVACRACDLFALCAAIDASADALSLRRCPTLRPLARGEVLYRAGSATHALYAIRKGLVKTTAPPVHGRTKVVALHIPGDVLGRESVRQAPHPNDAVAVTQAMVCELDLQPLRTCGSTSLRERIDRFGIEPQRVEFHMSNGLRERLHALFENLRARLRSRDMQADFAFQIGRGELARLLGLRSLGRAARLAQSAGLIELHGHQVHVQTRGAERGRAAVGRKGDATRTRS